VEDGEPRPGDIPTRNRSSRTAKETIREEAEQGRAESDQLFSLFPPKANGKGKKSVWQNKNVHLHVRVAVVKESRMQCGDWGRRGNW